MLTLAVLDLKSGEVIDTGIFTEDDAWYESSGRITPVWSPDSRSLIIAANFELDDYDVLLVDIGEQTAFKLPENQYVTGWLLPEEPGCSVSNTHQYAGSSGNAYPPASCSQSI